MGFERQRYLEKVKEQRDFENKRISKSRLYENAIPKAKNAAIQKHKETRELNKLKKKKNPGKKDRERIKELEKKQARYAKKREHDELMAYLRTLIESRLKKCEVNKLRASPYVIFHAEGKERPKIFLSARECGAFFGFFHSTVKYYATTGKPVNGWIIKKVDIEKFNLGRNDFV